LSRAHMNVTEHRQGTARFRMLGWRGSSRGGSFELRMDGLISRW
jgi:hypothetical protein